MLLVVGGALSPMSGSSTSVDVGGKARADSQNTVHSVTGYCCKALCSASRSRARAISLCPPRGLNLFLNGNGSTTSSGEAPMMDAGSTATASCDCNGSATSSREMRVMDTGSAAVAACGCNGSATSSREAPVMDAGLAAKASCWFNAGLSSPQRHRCMLIMLATTRRPLERILELRNLSTWTRRLAMLRTSAHCCHLLP